MIEEGQSEGAFTRAYRIKELNKIDQVSNTDLDNGRQLTLEERCKAIKAGGSGHPNVG